LATLSEAGMTLSPDKCYIGFHSVRLLGHVVDRFGLSTLDEKVEAISSMKFPRYLHELELFIGLSNYYRHFIARYAGIMEPLQSLKTKLLRGSEHKNKRQRAVYTKSKGLEPPTNAELFAFNAIKESLCSKFLYHGPRVNALVQTIEKPVT
jgi:hypothetical protein